MQTHYFGIDLGTSNCAVAAVAAEGKPAIVPIPQAVGTGSIEAQPLLPSVIFLAAESEFETIPELPGQSLPPGVTIGALARSKGSQQPDRIISSAKSWLCHAHVDRRGPILPWSSDVITEKWSPLAVSESLLKYLKTAVANATGEAELCGSNCVVTVPASFDEVARSLTVEAARNAGFADIVLLEEPQAAFYAWLESQGQDWRKQVKAGETLLVCDIGGGTADFTLIAVVDNDGDLQLERIAVGEHLLLGGDNMDLALAHALTDELEQAGTSLDDWQFLGLVQGVRSAKEAMLADAARPDYPIAIPSRSSRLLAKTLNTSLTRTLLEDVLLNGFFPMCDWNEQPQLRRPGGLREAGLPYAADPALSKHLARFLTRAHANLAASQPTVASSATPILLPDKVLFNGGVFNAPVLRDRILELLSRWSGSTVEALQGAAPDHAVAIGAAAYARLRATGSGLRIKSGTARSYYIGLDANVMAVPGRKPKIKALCVAPQGMEEGTATPMDEREFSLYTGETSEFRFFQSSMRPADQPGELLPDAAELEESAKLAIEIPPPAGHEPGDEIPVRIQAQVTELGNLELFMVHAASNQRWKLEFNVRMQ